MAKGSFDAYAVLREARGWSAESADHINVIARDLLWIRNTTEPLVEYRDAKDGVIGLYISAIDNQCYNIERIQLEEANVLLTGRSTSVSEPEQRITLTFGASLHRHALQTRDGILTGFAGAGRDLGAWKVLLIAPDWIFFDQLKTMLEQTTRASFFKSYRICEDVCAVGICYSNLLRRQYNSELERLGDGPRVNVIHDRRAAFHRLVSPDANLPPPTGSFGDFMSEIISRELRTSLAVIVGSTESDEEMNLAKFTPEQLTQFLLMFLGRLTKQYWYLIEPTQIINFRRRAISTVVEQLPQELREDIARLLELEWIARFPATRLEVT